MEAKKTFFLKGLVSYIPSVERLHPSVERLHKAVNAAIQKAISGGWPNRSVEAIALCDTCQEVIYRTKGASTYDWEHNDTRLTERLHKAEPYGPSILLLEEWEQRCKGCNKGSDECECPEPGTEIHLFEAQGRLARRLVIQPHEAWHTGLGVAPEDGFIRVMRIDPAHRGQPWVEDMDKFLCPWLFKEKKEQEKKAFRVYLSIRGDASIDCLAHDVEEACAYVERRLAEEGVTEFINAEDVEVYDWHTNVDRENSELNDYSG